MLVISFIPRISTFYLLFLQNLVRYTRFTNNDLPVELRAKWRKSLIPTLCYWAACQSAPFNITGPLLKDALITTGEAVYGSDVSLGLDPEPGMDPRTFNYKKTPVYYLVRPNMNSISISLTCS